MGGGGKTFLVGATPPSPRQSTARALTGRQGGRGGDGAEEGGGGLVADWGRTGGGLGADWGRTGSDYFSDCFDVQSSTLRVGTTLGERDYD